MSQQNLLGTQPLTGLIWKFAIPGIISTLINSLHNIVDQTFLGWGIGDMAIAATNIVFPIATITTALASLLGLGGAAVFSLSMGRKNEEGAKKCLGNAIMLMAILGVGLSALAIIFLEPMLVMFGATDVMMPYAKPYAMVISLGIPFGIFSTGMSHFVRADGNPRFSSAIPLSGALFNIIFDPIFLFVFRMGIEGVALATILGQLLSTILALYYLIRRFKSVRLVKSDLGLDFSCAKSICSLGGAPCFNHIIMTVSQITLMNTLRHYGALSVYGSEIAIAGAGAVGKVAIVMLSVVIGISLGCQPILGYNYGNKRYGRVKETYLKTVRYGTIVAVIAFLCLQLFPHQILRIFGSDNPLFYEFSTKYIRIYLVMTFANALQPITSTFFTSIGKAKMGLLMAIIRQGLLLIPLILILPRFLGIDGALWAGAISDGAAAIVVVVLASREMKNLTKLQASQKEF